MEEILCIKQNYTLSFYFIRFDVLNKLIKFYMQQKIHFSHETTLALQQLKAVLDSRNISLEQLLTTKNIHSNQLDHKDFKAFISEFTQMKPQHIFKSLSGQNHTVSVSDLNKIMSKLEKTPSKNNEVHPGRKSKHKDMDKNSIQTVIQKLRQYLARLPNPRAFLVQFDTDKNGSIDKFEFSNMLMATGMRYFDHKKIRKQVVDSIFKQKQLKKFEISLSELCHYLGIKETEKMPQNVQKEQKNYTLPPQNNEKQPHKFQLPRIPIQQTQESENVDLQNTYPLSKKYYPRKQFLEQQVLEQLQELLKKNTKFIDKQNPKIQKGIYVPAVKILNSKYHIFQSENDLFFPSSRTRIAQQLQPKNVIQGKIDDCYFISSIASLITKHPNLIISKFLLTTNPSNFYAIKLFINGEWKIIKTDDHFPCKGNILMYAKPHKIDIWVMLLEKAWAKVFGSYRGIELGYSNEGFTALSGAPSEIYDEKIVENQIKAIKLLEEIQRQKYVATLSSKEKQGLKQQGQKLGLSVGHSYSYLKKIIINGENIIQLRDPVGQTKWQGDWSFNCKKWTQQLREKYRYKDNPQDGSFYMSFSDFRKYFSEIVVCKINPQFVNDSIRSKTTPNKSAYFLMQIKTAGKYTVSIYQASQGKRKQHYSLARIIILKDQGKEMIYVGSKVTQKDQVCSVEMELQEGEYDISVKVVSKQFQSSQLVLTSYGTDHVKFIPKDRQIAPKFKQQMIRSYAKKFSGKEEGKISNKKQKGIEATREDDFNYKTGIGFIRMVNNKNKRFNIEESKIRGQDKRWKLIDSHLTFSIGPNQQKVYGYLYTAQQ